MEENKNQNEQQESVVQPQDKVNTEEQTVSTEAETVQSTPNGDDKIQEEKKKKYLCGKKVSAVILSAAIIFGIGFAGGAVANAVLQTPGHMQQRMYLSWQEDGEQGYSRNEDRSYGMNGQDDANQPKGRIFEDDSDNDSTADENGRRQDGMADDGSSFCYGADDCMKNDRNAQQNGESSQANRQQNGSDERGHLEQGQNGNSLQFN
ncbi:MAG: hypothetical protein VB082_00975 [Christensenella sp.]|nr:hypothetical protein [Christensenella sp.]